MHLVLQECCVVDGDSPPERFDHISTLTDEYVLVDTPTNSLILSETELTSAKTQTKSQIPSGIAQHGFKALQRVGLIVMSPKGRD
tara:strand:+ start:361 stop:615 length:255 start_codon:yes stop_codon:yes gene_type:complete